MDKETLSNYGWIVIAVLVLAVMIALATPFGSFVSGAVKSTTTGLFETNKNALNSTGLINIADQSFDDGSNTTAEIKRNGVIPEGATYYKGGQICEYCGNVSGIKGMEHGVMTDASFEFTKEPTATYTGGQAFPETVDNGDIYVEGDYRYCYINGGWVVTTIENKSSYNGTIPVEIDGKAVTNMDYTFFNCTSLTTAPVIPSSITSMTDTFGGCTSLSGTVEINAVPQNGFSNSCFDGTVKPITLTRTNDTAVLFDNLAKNHSNITIANSTLSAVRDGTIPNGAIYTKADGTVLNGNGTNMFPDVPTTGDVYEEGDYRYKYSVHSIDMTSDNKMVTNYWWTVSVKDNTKTEYGTILSEIMGEKIWSLKNTFQNCTSMITAPTIPSSVTDMEGTFNGCTSLTTAPTIPSKVTNMTGTFNGCKSLITAPIIPNSVTSMKSTFMGCTSLTTAPKIPNSVTDMTSTFSGCTSLTTASTIPSKVIKMDNIFFGCTALTGTIEINANPNSGSYRACFLGTSKPIILTGSSKMLSQIAEGRSNITVQ